MSSKILALKLENRETVRAAIMSPPIEQHTLDTNAEKQQSQAVTDV